MMVAPRRRQMSLIPDGTAPAPKERCHTSTALAAMGSRLTGAAVNLPFRPRGLCRPETVDGSRCYLADVAGRLEKPPPAGEALHAGPGSEVEREACSRPQLGQTVAAPLSNAGWWGSRGPSPWPRRASTVARIATSPGRSSSKSSQPPSVTAFVIAGLLGGASL